MAKYKSSYSINIIICHIGVINIARRTLIGLLESTISSYGVYSAMEISM